MCDSQDSVGTIKTDDKSYDCDPASTTCCSCMSNSTFDNSQLSDHAVSQPVGTSSSKWATYSAVVNKNRREAYKANPTLGWSRSLQYYYKNKHHILEKYHNNPLPTKHKALYRYHSDPSITRKNLDRYHSNPSPIKRKNESGTMLIHHQLNIMRSISTGLIL